MKSFPTPTRATRALCQTAPLLVLALAGSGAAQAAEGFKLRQSAVGVFGGEMAAGVDNPGFFGTASLSYVDIYKVVDASGANITVAGRNVPLPTAAPSGGAVPDGRFTLVVPSGTIDFQQRQTQLNLVGGYLSESTYGDGRIAVAVNLPLIQQSRSFVVTQEAGTVSPTPAAALPAPVRAVVAGVAAAANAQVRAGVAANVASQNAETSGMGDTELSLVWVRHQERLKIAAGVSLFVPTGDYDKTRGPNPGFGNFYTLRPGVAVTYSLNPRHTDEAWDAGVTVAGRISYGINTTNKDTDYRSGNFVYVEAGITKVMGNWAIGSNVLSVQQTSDDSGAGVPAGTGRYRNYGFGPFLSYKLPGQDAGFNLHYSENFGSRSALVAKTVQLRFIKAW